MGNDYLDKLEAELALQGVVSSHNVLSADDRDLKVVLDMEQALGIKYSDEQKNILLHRGNSVILACAGSGKALVNGTRVVTPDGYKNIEDLRIGDKIFDNTGHIQVVTGVYPQGEKYVNKVVLNDGREIFCCLEHLWTVYNKECRFWRVLSTKEIMELIDSYQYEFMLPVDIDIFGNISNEYLELADNVVLTIYELIDMVKEYESDNQELLNKCEKCKEWHELRPRNNKRPVYNVCMSDGYKLAQSEAVKNVLKQACNWYGISTCYKEDSNVKLPLSIIKIKKLKDKKEMTCISVTGKTQLFMLEGCIPTHNTTVSTHLIAKRIQTREIPDVSKMIYATYNKAGALEMQDRLQKIMQKLGFNYNIKVKTLHAFFYSMLKEFRVACDVISEGQKYRMFGEICREIGFNTKDDTLVNLINLVSYQVNNLLGDKKTIECMYNNVEDLTIEQYAKIRNLYANKKKEAKLMDYDDMQTYLWSWLVRNKKSTDANEVKLYKDVLDWCQYNFTDFYIDEAQDVSKIQFKILSAMVTEPDDEKKLKARLTFIGDDDQCLVEGTRVRVRDGYKNIEEIGLYDHVVAGSGSGDTVLKRVLGKSCRVVNEDIVVITTKSGKVLKGTANHVGFARTRLLKDKYYVYLTYDKICGFESGVIKAHKTDNIKEILISKLKENDSSRIWIVECTNNLETANKINEELLKDIKGDGSSILKDRMLFFDYPHAINEDEIECVATIKMLNTDSIGKDGLHKSRANSRIKKGHGNVEIRDLTDDETIDGQLLGIRALQFSCKTKGMSFGKIEQARFTRYNYDTTPFGHMFEGMQVPVVVEEHTTQGIKRYITDDEIVSIQRVHYSGNVYDLEIGEAHNFSANDIIVHNCIYEWRGSSPSVIQCIGSDFNIKTSVLSTNYRCLSEVVDFSTTGVKNNSRRYEKGMNAFTNGGSVKIACSSNSLQNLYEPSVIAFKHIYKLISNGVSPSDIAVLSRNNRHLTILNSLLLKEGIYCDCTEDMKVTRGSLYADVKMIVDMCDNCWDSSVPKKVMWKFNNFIGKNVSNAISNFMDTCSISLEQTFGHIVKTYIDSSVQLLKPIRPNIVADTQLSHYMSGLNTGVKETVKQIFASLTCDKKEDRFSALSALYIEGTRGSVYKTPDKMREARGLISLLKACCKSESFEQMRDFLKLIEQFEKGTMGVMGEKVTLSTIHSAKGREWKYVIMFAADNLSEPNFDSIKIMSEDENISVHDINNYLDEERRLFYVGNTRAKSDLLLITNDKPSVFLLECLGADIGNTKIMSMSYNMESVREYKDIIEQKIKDKNSKYYYEQ